MFKVADPVQNAYRLFASGTSPAAQFLTTIASSGTRRAPLGTQWEAQGPMDPSAAQARPDPPTVAVGAGSLILSAQR